MISGCISSVLFGFHFGIPLELLQFMFDHNEQIRLTEELPLFYGHRWLQCPIAWGHSAICRSWSSPANGCRKNAIWCDLLNQHGDIQARILGFMVPFLDILEASLKISASSLQKKPCTSGRFLISFSSNMSYKSYQIAITILSTIHVHSFHLLLIPSPLCNISSW